MKVGDIIRIIPSIALSEMRLDKLAGRPGIITEVKVSSNKIMGCWVMLARPYLGEYEWYIPYNSIWDER